VCTSALSATYQICQQAHERPRAKIIATLDIRTVDLVHFVLEFMVAILHASTFTQRYIALRCAFRKTFFSTVKECCLSILVIK
jgi:hypothetical protein